MSKGSMEVKVLAIDPGRTTGFCYATIEDSRAVLMPWQEHTEVHNMWSILEKRKPDVIVIEKFEFRKNSREGLDLFPKELIGTARLHSTLNHSEWYEQSAAQGKGYWGDSLLRDSQVYLKAMPHANDATRHFLHWFTFGAGFKYNTTGEKFPFKLVDVQPQ